MMDAGLSSETLELMRSVFKRHPEVTEVLLFGSRALGTAAANSDIDLALKGVGDELKAQSIAGELDELPLPYRFDVKAYESIRNPALLEHIQRVGVRL